MLSHRLCAGRLFAALGLALVLSVAALTGALAEVVAPTVPVVSAGSLIDFQPLLVEGVNLAIMIGGSAIGTLALAVLARLRRLAGVKATAEEEFNTRAKVDQALFHAAAFARQRAAAAGPLTVDVGSDALAAGARYAMQSIPETLKGLGITDAASERLKEMVEARLGVPAT